jgi:hypothetical protein
MKFHVGVAGYILELTVMVSCAHKTEDSKQQK